MLNVLINTIFCECLSKKVDTVSVYCQRNVSDNVTRRMYY